MNFKGKKFQYVEYAKGHERNRGNFATLSDIEKLVWTNYYDNEELWRTMYSYCDIQQFEVSFGPYYFESDITDFETNRKAVLWAVNHFNIEYDIPFNAFKFKFTNKSIWVEIIPSVMGIRPSRMLNEIYKEITLYLNRMVSENLGIPHAFDTNVYAPRQFSRVAGSFLPKSNRYVIELTYAELAFLSYQEILYMARRKKKVTYPPNSDFAVSLEACHLFEQFKEKVYSGKPIAKQNNLFIAASQKERLCIRSMKENGVGEGNRNVALFYASIDSRDKGISQKEWEKQAYQFMSNFEKNKIDSYSQIRATVKSAYKEKYLFSCRKIRESMPEHCQCEHCPFVRAAKQDVFKIYRKGLNVLLKGGADSQTFKDYIACHYYAHFSVSEKMNALKRIKDLKKMGLILSGNRLNPDYQKGSYLSVPTDFFHQLDTLKAELVLFIAMLSSSPNGTHLNPKMKTEHYAQKIGKSVRTVQRYIRQLKKLHFLDDTCRLFYIPEPEEVHQVVDIQVQEKEKATEKTEDTHLSLLTEQKEKATAVRTEKKKTGLISKRTFKPLFVKKKYVNMLSINHKKTEIWEKDKRKEVATFGYLLAAP